MQLRESFDVRLINDRFPPAPARRTVVFPVESRINYSAQRRQCRAVTLVEREVAVLMANFVSEKFVTPNQRPPQSLRIGIEEDFVRVESMAGLRFVRPVHAITIDLARLDCL